MDFEATCEDGDKKWPSEIIEWPAVCVRACDGQVVGEFESFVRPVERPTLTPFCTELTSITQREVDTAPELSEVLASFSAWLKTMPPRVLPVFCGDWDLRTCLPRECRRKGLRGSVPRVLEAWCNVKVPYRSVLGEKSRGMESMLRTLGLELVGRHHRGIDDSRNIARIAAALAARAGPGVLMRTTFSPRDGEWPAAMFQSRDQQHGPDPTAAREALPTRKSESTKAETRALQEAQRFAKADSKWGAAKAATKKVVTSALCFVPDDPEAWAAIQALRGQYDRQIKRWPPHVNLVYPFVPVGDLAEAALKLEAALAGLAPFDVNLGSLGHFKHGAKSFTAFCQLDDASTSRLVGLQRACEAVFPGLDDLSTRFQKGGGFKPHLTVGQFSSQAQVDRLLLGQGPESWNPRTVRCSQVVLVARAGQDQPFLVHHTVPFGGGGGGSGGGAPRALPAKPGEPGAAVGCADGSDPPWTSASTLAPSRASTDGGQSTGPAADWTGPPAPVSGAAADGPRGRRSRGRRRVQGGWAEPGGETTSHPAPLLPGESAEILPPPPAVASALSGTAPALTPPSPPLALIDIGVNLTNRAFKKDAAEVVRRAALAGVSPLVVTGTSLRASAEAQQLVHRLTKETRTAQTTLQAEHRAEKPLFFTAGVHPHDAKGWGGATAAGLRALLADPCCVAVGECGLDFNRSFSAPEAQELAFRSQVELACALGKPLFLHERDAHLRFLHVLAPFLEAPGGGGEAGSDAQRLPVEAVVHCFTGTATEARAYLDLGFYLGFTGCVCMPERGRRLRDEVLPLVPLDRLLLETDAPFMHPSGGRRGGRCEPIHMRQICTAVAAAMGRTETEVAVATTANAGSFFGISS